MENFKKFSGGPSKAAEHGRPSDPKTIGTSPVKHPHSQDPKVGKHKGRSTLHSPPNTSQTRKPAPPANIIKHQAAMNAVNPGGGMPQTHATVQGARSLKGDGDMVRPNMAQLHTLMRGLRAKIGKAKKKNAMTGYVMP